MRKALAILLVTAVCMAAPAVAGCGGDTDQARSYMEQGDSLSSGMRALTDEAVFDAGALLAELGIQVGETGTVDKKTVTDAAEDQLDRLIDNGEKAVAEYEKILGLKGVDEYKEYARKRIAAIESSIKVLEAINELLSDIGDPANTRSTASTLADWAKSNVKVAAEALKAYANWRDAESIKKKNNLGPAEQVEESAPFSSPE